MINFEQMFSLLERIDPQYRQYKQLINEADSRLKQVDRIIDQVFGEHFNLDSVVDDAQLYVNNNPNTTYRQFILFNLRHTFGLMQNSDVKYLPVVARLAYSNEVGLNMTTDNEQQINTLRRIVNLFKKDANLFNEVKNNPNITFSQLAERFKEAFAQEDAADAEAANSVQNSNNGYTIKEVPDFETAKYYGDRSCSESKLCYTQGVGTWNQYTKNGMNRVYVCLKNGWENIPEVATNGNPYDEYGTSMIFVFINPKGDLVTSNCRWNHENVGDYDGDVDHAFTKATLSHTIGIPFDSVFKPVDNFDEETYIRKSIEQGGGMLGDSISGDFVIPDGITNIGNDAFSGCYKLTSVVIPDSVTSIGQHAFYDCERLNSVRLSNNITFIGQGTFEDCYNLTSITIPDSVTEIDYDVFNGCSGLTKIDLGNGLTKIGQGTFQSCINLTSINIPDSVTEIDNWCFYGCTSLTSIRLPNGIKKISNYTFYECKNLRNIVIPNSVTYIGKEAFCECTSLTSVTIPNSVTTIADNAFYWCRNLTRINIPNSVTEIGYNVFSNCPKVTIYVESEETANLLRQRIVHNKIQINGSTNI